MSPPRAILFDIGDTLLKETRFDLEAGIRAVVGDHPDVVAELCRSFRAELHESHRIDRELDLPGWIGARLPDRDDPSTTTLEDTLWSSVVSLAQIPGVESMLHRLRNDNVMMAAISNAPFSGRALSAELERHGLGNIFQFVLSSADIGFRKPNFAIFEIALWRLGLSAKGVWFVGNSWSEDVVGATTSGLRPVWLSEDGTHPPSDLSVVRVRDWIEFISVYEATRAETGKQE